MPLATPLELSAMFWPISPKVTVACTISGANSQTAAMPMKAAVKRTGETESVFLRMVMVCLHLAKNPGYICLHVASYGGSDAAQEGDEVDGEYPAEKMDDAPAEVHGLIGRVAHET